MHEDNVVVVDIDLKNAHFYNAFLTSRHVHDEYKEELNSRRFSATFGTKPFQNQHALHDRVREEHHMEDASSHHHNVNLFIFNHFSGHGLWSIVANLVKYLLSKAPRLRSIQIGTKLDSPKVAFHKDVHRPEYWAAHDTATHPMFRLELPPAFIAETSALDVCGEGYHCGYAKASRLNKFTTHTNEAKMDTSQYFVLWECTRFQALKKEYTS
jgi:hypothetical protein